VTLQALDKLAVRLVGFSLIDITPYLSNSRRLFLNKV